jgi:hypothetical protein
MGNAMRNRVIERCVGVFALMGVTLVGTACSSGQGGGAGINGGGETAAGEVGLQLRVGSFLVQQLTYTLTNGSFTSTGTVDVGDADALSFVIPNVPAGTGFQLSISGTTTDGASCSGKAGPFAVVARETTVVAMELACVGPRDAGSVLVNATANACPTVDALFSDPPVGIDIQLHAQVTDSDHGPGPLRLIWGASGGTLSSHSDPNPVMTCTSGGFLNVFLTVQDGANIPNEEGCVNQYVLTVKCPTLPPDSGTTSSGDGMPLMCPIGFCYLCKTGIIGNCAQATDPVCPAGFTPIPGADCP